MKLQWEYLKGAVETTEFHEERERRSLSAEPVLQKRTSDPKLVCWSPSQYVADEDLGTANCDGDHDADLVQV